MNRIQRLILEDRIENLILVVSSERRLTKQHLVNQHSKRPPIYRSSVALFQNDLRENEISENPRDGSRRKD